MIGKKSYYQKVISLLATKKYTCAERVTFSRLLTKVCNKHNKGRLTDEEYSDLYYIISSKIYFKETQNV